MQNFKIEKKELIEGKGSLDLFTTIFLKLIDSDDLIL
jgi:hypothetical protein